MRELTFKGYLLSQLQELSEVKTTSLYTFSYIAENNARLKDTLCLYLVLFTKENLRNKLLKKYIFLAEDCNFLKDLTIDNIHLFFSENNLSQYKTIYENYLYMHNKKTNTDKIKAIMYSKILEVKNLKNITNYRIYTTLKLNPGNANAFLKNGDISKVSLNTTRQILQFVNEY